MNKKALQTAHSEAERTMETVTIDYYETKARPTFGIQHIKAYYVMTHVKHGRVNKYMITCEISGMQVHDVELMATSAEFMGDMEIDSNDETLTESAAMQLFEDNM